MARSGSASSNEYSQDEPSGPIPGNKIPPSSTDSPANQRRQPPGRPPPPRPADPNKPKENFFNTLDWKEEGEGLLDEEEEETRRPRNDSAEDGFADLSENRQTSGVKLLDTDFGQPETVDLLNINSAGSPATNGVATGDQLSDGMSLLDIGGPEPTTLELLTGVSEPSQPSANKPGNLLDDGFDFFGGPSEVKPAADQNKPNNTFDPFQSVPTEGSPKPPRPSQPPKSAPTVSKKEGAGLDIFDPFQDFTTQSSQSKGSSDFLGLGEEAKPSKKTASGHAPTDDLMGSWGGSDFGGAANTATSPGFLGSGGPMGMGGMPQRTQPSPMGGPPSKPNDPFADLGE